MDTDRIDRILYETNALLRECGPDDAKASFLIGAIKCNADELLRIVEGDRGNTSTTT